MIRIRLAGAALGLVCIFAFAAALRGDDQASDKPPAADKPQAEGAEPEIGQLRVLTLKPITYLHASVETTMQEVANEIKKMVPGLLKAGIEAKVAPGTPIIAVYHGASGDPAAKVTMDLGFAVPPGTAAPADYKVSDLHEYHCVSVLYSGPANRTGEAFEKKLVPAITDGSHRPTEESREMFLYWEGEDSPNNVIQCTIGIEK